MPVLGLLTCYVTDVIICTHLSGTAIAYHAVSLGFYMDQIVRRVDPQHRCLSQFFREELAETLGEGNIVYSRFTVLTVVMQLSNYHTT